MLPRYYPELQRYSPTRPLDWRWRRAQQLVYAGRYYSTRRDDEDTGRAVRFLRELRRCDTEGHRARLARSFPDLDAARRLHEAGGNLAIEVQARLLARQSPEEIARLMPISGQAVESYQSFFFNISDRLHAKGWVMATAVRWWSFDLAKGRDRATLLKGYAYHAGAVVLDAVLPYLLGDRLASPPPTNSTSPDAQLDRSIRLAIEIDSLPWDAQSNLKLIKLHADLLETHRSGAGSVSRTSVLARHVAEVAAHLDAGVLQEAPRRDHPADTANVRHTA